MMGNVRDADYAKLQNSQAFFIKNLFCTQGDLSDDCFCTTGRNIPQRMSVFWGVQRFDIQYIISGIEYSSELAFGDWSKALDVHWHI
jgi:hypothetical protein